MKLRAAIYPWPESDFRHEFPAIRRVYAAPVCMDNCTGPLRGWLIAFPWFGKRQAAAGITLRPAIVIELER